MSRTEETKLLQYHRSYGGKSALVIADGYVPLLHDARWEKNTFTVIAPDTSLGIFATAAEAAKDRNSTLFCLDIHEWNEVYLAVLSYLKTPFVGFTDLKVLRLEGSDEIDAALSTEVWTRLVAIAKRFQIPIISSVHGGLLPYERL